MVIKLPRIVCTQCLAVAAVELVRVDGRDVPLTADHQLRDVFVRMRCHDREEIFLASKLSDSSWPDELLWSTCVSWAESDRTLAYHEGNAIETMLGQIDRLQLAHRMRRNHGAAKTIIPKEKLDSAIDTLLLFREDG